jgi:hypothetical protein
MGMELTLQVFIYFRVHPLCDSQCLLRTLVGVAGGNTNGVARGANVYGLKVMDAAGQGFTSAVIAAIDYVLANRAPGRGSVINLSLGGPCDTSDCSVDPTVLAVNAAVAAGVVVVVAAGNEFCNAASSSIGSPPAAANAITVGATTRLDALAYYSNYGQMVDILAPGSSIISACSTLAGNCDANGEATKTGTSIAAPHVAGVAAQLLQKNSAATPAQVLRAMQCDAIEGIITLPSRDTITRNLFLQIPKNDGLFGTCIPGNGCTSNCSSVGHCLAAHTSSSYGSTEDICYCNGGYGSGDCSVSFAQARTNQCASAMTVTISMTASSSKCYRSAFLVIFDYRLRNTK